jgi:CubicO group peptidase (beta-lactamase class C family)
MKRALLAAIALPAVLAAQQPGLPGLADRVFGPWNSTHTPGCAVGVARGGAVLLTRGYGMADLETGTPITPATTFESGSVAKQFTATATVLLALDGKLDLDDPVRKYIPELPDYGRPVTIRHLLTHTSGLREWSSLVAAQGWPRGSRRHTQDVLFDVVTHQRSLNYPSGDYYSYTNSGYGLLFTIVERVSGQPFERFFEQHIFGPLGMTHTRWRDDFTRLVPGRAQAYARERDGWHLDMPFEDVVGPGGLLTTVGDWLIWNDALTNRTLGAALVDSLSHRMRLTGGREIEYALGLFFTAYRGVPEISHGGATAGYRTFLARYPDRGNLSIAVLCNAANADAASYAHALADALIDDFPAAVEPDTAAVDSAAFARAAGVYRNDRSGAALVVTTGMASRFRALPSGWLWTASGATWHVESGAGGRPAHLRIAQSDGDTVTYTRAADQVWQPTAHDLAALEGRYQSDELDVTYLVTAVGDTLTLSPRAGLVERLRPTYPDGFEGAGTAVWFSRDRAGRVTAMHFGQSRMWDLVLARQR